MKKFIKEKYNILIPVFLIIVILIAVFLYTREYKNNRYAKTEEVDVYKYFSGLKLEYKAKIQCLKCRLFYHLNPNICMILKSVFVPYPHLSYYFFF